MKKVSICILFLFQVCFAKSQSQAKVPYIKRLIYLTKQDSLLDNTFSNSIKTMLSIYDTKTRSRMEQQTEALKPTIKNIHKNLIEKDLPALYDKYYSLDEIKQLINFYESPIGKKMTYIFPTFNSELMLILQKKYFPDLQSAVKALAN